MSWIRWSQRILPARSNKYALALTIALGFVAVFFLFAATSAIRAEGPIEFVEPSEMRVDFDDLANEGGCIYCSVLNPSSLDQDVDIGVAVESSNSTPSPSVTLSSSFQVPVGNPYPPVPVWKLSRDSQKILSGQTLTFVFILDVSKRPESGIYSYRIVADSPTGQIVRKLAIQVKGTENVASDSIKYQPTSLGSLIFAGTNFLPSVLSPLRGFLFFIFIISIVLWLSLNLGIIVRHLSKTPKKVHFIKSDICLAVGAVCGLLLIALLFLPVSDEQANVKIGRISVEAGDLQIVGQVADSEGKLGSIIRIGDKLDVIGIKKAGLYAGTSSLPGNEKIATTVAVSDYWPWPFFTIAAGVALGYFITWYYSAQRTPEEKKGKGSKTPRDNESERPLMKSIHDWEVGAVVGLLAIGSGYATLYFKSQYWGSYLDYLIAFLWGAVGSQGLKYVASILNKIPLQDK